MPSWVGPIILSIFIDEEPEAQKLGYLSKVTNITQDIKPMFYRVYPSLLSVISSLFPEHISYSPLCQKCNASFMMYLVSLHPFSHCSSLSCCLASSLLRGLPCATVTSCVYNHCCNYHAIKQSPIDVFAILHKLPGAKNRSFSL